MVKPQTILLVDDHSLITTAMSALLQSMYPDVQIHVGATAKEAVELAEKYGDLGIVSIKSVNPEYEQQNPI